MATINEKSVAHLADLSRVDLSTNEIEKLTGDLEKILEHVEDLKTVDTEHVLAMTGGTELKNVFRKDEEPSDGFNNVDKIIEAFPEREKGYLKIPPVF